MTVATTDVREDLLARIREKRQQVEVFVGAALPRKRRLLNVTIFGGTLAAAFTAGPAAGGASFTAWLTSTFGLTSPSWQLLCGAAAACSVAATVSTQLLKSQNIEEHVARAQSCRAKLEVLEVGLTTGHLDTSQATSEFIRCVEEVSFLDAR
jgi:MFS family permease